MRYLFLMLTMPCLCCEALHADVIEYTDYDEWSNDAGSFTTIGFTGFNDGAIITTQYVELGVTFTDGNDNITGPDTVLFPNDGWGLRGNLFVNQGITLAFSEPIFSIGVDFPGAVQVDLFLQGDLVYSSSGFGPSGTGHFAGLASATPFDSAVIVDWIDNNVFIDDLHFTTIPAPGTLALLGLGVLGAGRRRRREST